jgi:PhnB protein
MTKQNNTKGLINPYISFDGRCEEAIEFYRKAVGAEVEMMLRFKDSPEPCDPSMVKPGSENKIMHASFKIGQSVIMASDCRCDGQTNFTGFTLSYSLPDEASVDRAFNALSEGGQVQMPLDKTFFSPRFGVLTDRFGISWMILVSPPQS